MPYPIVTIAIEQFLQYSKNPHNADLVDRYTRAMETQVNVHIGDGHVSEEARNTFTNGVLQWFNFRVPKGAKDNPHHSDWTIKWPLELYADGIGMTGWDWDNKVSRWVAYDFDSITEHAKGVGLEAEDLLAVSEKAKNIPWIQVRRSTGGGGLHLYVYFNSKNLPTTENHTEHSALARSVLGLMSAEAGFDFQSRLDVCGGNTWVWHNKMTLENEGLKILKQHEEELQEVPLNWKDHLPVINRQQTRVNLAGIESNDETSFNKLSSSRKREPLDDGHKALISFLESSNYATVWNADHHCLQTHTCAFLEYATQLHSLNDTIRGFYETTSQASDKSKPNCFAFPMANGAWKLVRFGRGSVEAKTWQHDKENWTWCYFNRKPDLAMSATAFGALESTNQRYEFENLENAQEAIKHLGASLNLPDRFADRKVSYQSHKDGRLVVTMPQMEGDNEADMRTTGWIAERGKKWLQIYNIQTRVKDAGVMAPELEDLDDEVRVINTCEGETAGYVLKHFSGGWVHHPCANAKLFLKSRGFSPTEVDNIMGDSIFRAWTTVNNPFSEEYPGNREWNKDAAQLRYGPANVEPTEVHHPHWDKILAHCGQDLDETLASSPWARKHGIHSGKDYLTMWIACMIREPYDPLPYLFFYGEQNCGKSSFREAIELLVTKGCTQADQSLTSTSGFNGELYGSILCYVEETDLSKSGSLAYNRVKEYVTNLNLSVHMKFMQPFMTRNTTHWCQMANKREFCLVVPGDTRIIIMHVQDLLEDIPKTLLMSKLQDEAPHFMRTLIDLELPPATGRLRLPVITTESKKAAAEANKDALQSFLDDHTYYTPGAKVLFKDFYKQFHDSLSAWERSFWQKRAVLSAMPTPYPVGNGSGNRRFVGNISFTEVKTDDLPLVLQDKKLVPRKPKKEDE